jgi:alanine dehydrogenase
MLLLSEADVRSVLPMTDLIDTMQAALVDYAVGAAQQPLRTVLEINQQAFFGVMPAHVPGRDALGTKLVTVFEENAALGLPTHLATIVLLNPSTGELLSVMDGRYITEARTAAVSAVATRLLSRPDASTLALIGSGVQARSHLDAIARVRTLRRVAVWSPHADRRRAFVSSMQPQTSVPIVDAHTASEAVRDADIVALVSSAREPVVRVDWIAPGAHICAVGACRPAHREMETALVARSRLFVDSRRGALAESGDVIIPIEEGAFTPDHICGELGEVAAGQVVGRRSADEITIFKSLGMAIEDVAAAHLAYQRAVTRGLGVTIPS